MNFNSLFFPAPANHYAVTTHFGEMIYIPKDYEMVPDEVTGEPKPKLNVQNLQNVASITDFALHSQNLIELKKNESQLKLIANNHSGSPEKEKYVA